MFILAKVRPLHSSFVLKSFFREKCLISIGNHQSFYIVLDIQL